MIPTAVKSTGSYIYDSSGKDYLDASSCVLNMNLGHNNQEITDVIKAQLNKIVFVHRSQFESEENNQLTKKLLKIAPTELTSISYVNSGSEALELAIRATFAYQQRIDRKNAKYIVSEIPSYHGMTGFALGATGTPHKIDISMKNLYEQFDIFKKVQPTNGRLRANLSDWRAVLSKVGYENIAAVILEPIGGASSGAAVVDKETISWIRGQADNYGFTIISDEVMSGFGRTGKWWGGEHLDLKPDIITSGKGLTAGYTSLSTVFCSQKIEKQLGTPISSITYGHTMSGNPLSAKTATAVLDYIVKYDLIEAANIKGDTLKEGLEHLSFLYPNLVSEIRGYGLMLGVGLSTDESRSLFVSRQLASLARSNGLVVCAAGINTNTESLLIAPPLTITSDEIQEILHRLEITLKQFSKIND